MAGKLYVCATPIGNLEDITLRCLEVLKSVDMIAAEDTRNTVKLLNSYNIKTPLTSYHKFNEESKGRRLMEELEGGADIALVSDAGMPGISDPGEVLINMCHEAGIDVVVVPGASACITALVLSGIGGRSFIFEGFLPLDRHMRREVLDRLKEETRTVIFYEAPHHLKETLRELYRSVGDREAAAVRELTKKHEEIKRMKLSRLIDYFDENEPRGEFVIVLKGADHAEIKRERIKAAESIPIEQHYADLIEKGLDRKAAMKQCAKERGISKKEVYAELVSHNKA